LGGAFPFYGGGAGNPLAKFVNQFQIWNCWYGRLIDNEGNPLGVAAVFVFVNQDGSRAAFTTFVDDYSWLLDDFTAACMGQGITWPSGSDNKERLNSANPVFNYLPDRLDKLGSSLIYDVLDGLGGPKKLEEL
jgi:hypothetical protein